ncbi:pentapeptide repeat-containing protein [Salinibaculum rarum]|uniref:pentapeptide repeat-containing protein n=1 Tax=Salinibaculum rarum TaxID=3058903 RepID=UPI0034E94541
MGQDERATHNVTATDIIRELEANLETGDPHQNEYVDANIPRLALTHQSLNGGTETSLTLNFQYATIEGLDLTYGTLKENLNLKSATIENFIVEEATVNGRIEAENATFNGTVDAYETEFTSDVHFTNAVFRDEVRCDEARFNDDTDFSNATFEGAAKFRNVRTQGTSHELNDHISFENAEFNSTADFKDAEFEYVTFENATFYDAGNFCHAVFGGNTIFTDVVFNRVAEFDEAQFLEDVAFNSTTFDALAEFRGAQFSGGSRTVEDDVTFADASFNDDADFKLAYFRYANFDSATIAADCNLDRATFTAPALFTNITISGDVELGDATFEARAEFDTAEFNGEIRAQATDFKEDASFESAIFNEHANFDEVRFREDASFQHARFNETAHFRGALFEGEAKHLEENASFRDVTFVQQADFSSSDFQTASFWDVEFRDEVNFRETTFRKEVKFRVTGRDTDIYVDLTEATINGGIIEEGGGDIVPYDLTKATLGNVQLKGENSTYELLDYFRFCLTEFEQFDFSNHHTSLERNDWNIHSFVETQADVQPAVEMTNDVIEETYRRAQESADAVGDTTAMRNFEFLRWYYNRQKNYDIVRNEYSLNALTRIKKSAGIALNLFMQYTCGYANRVPRILVTMAGITMLYGLLYTMGGPFETTVGVIWNAENPLHVLYDGIYYSGITFTTIGYGNNAPLTAGWAAKFLAASEGYLSALLFTLLTVTFMRSAIGSS